MEEDNVLIIKEDDQYLSYEKRVEILLLASDMLGIEIDLI